MSGICQRDYDLVFVDKKIFYVNGMTTTYPEAKKFCNTLQTAGGTNNVELHHNNTTPKEKVVEAVVKLVLGFAGVCYSVASEKKNREKKAVDLALGAASAGVFAWGIYDLYEIQRKKEESADQLANKVCAYLQNNPPSDVTLVLHSQGADIGFQALEKLDCFKDRIHVITIGGKFEIPSSFAKRVTNFANERDLISAFARAATNPIPGKVTEIRSQKTCKTNFCHGAVDYLVHPKVKETFLKYTEPDYFCFNRFNRTAYPVEFA